MNINCLEPTASIVDAIRAIEKNSERIVVVVSTENNLLLGTLTDGDIRRHILDGHSLDASVLDVMNSNPISAWVDMPDSVLRELFFKNNIRGIPLVDNENKFIRIIYKTDISTKKDLVDEKTFAAAIIMAGGEGTRLRPLTKNIPKPMIEINGIPLLERQMESLKSIGVFNIYISINYLGNLIKDYFGDGKDYGVQIKYINETEKLGTAGALGLIPDLNYQDPILVINGDIVTTSDFSHLYQFHADHQADITVTAKDYRIEIPYGVIKYEGVKITSIEEKPSQRFFCNAGIYVLTPQIINDIKSQKFLNMTDVIEQCISDGGSVSVFPLHEYWSDIGTEADLENARNEFKDN